MKTATLTLATLFCATAFAQTATPPTQSPAATSAPAPVSALPDAPSALEHILPPAVPTGPTVLIDTTMGRLTCKLFSVEAPITTANFIGLATGTRAWTDPTTSKKILGTPFYDGTTFHRVIPGFMIQGGDRTGTGAGDAGYYFNDEISPSLRFDVPGRLAMANSGPNTNSAQFFITTEPEPTLDGQYNIFGQCDAHSVLLASSIELVQRNADNKPITPVVIHKVTIVPVGQPIPPDPMVPAPTPAPPATSSPQN